MATDAFASKDLVPKESVNALDPGQSADVQAVSKTAYQKSKQGGGFSSAGVRRQQLPKASADQPKPAGGKKLCLYCNKKHLGDYCFKILCRVCRQTGHSPANCKVRPVSSAEGKEGMVGNVDFDSEENSDLWRHVNVVSDQNILQRVDCQLSLKSGSAVQVKALPDSGASISCVPLAVVEQLRAELLPSALRVKNADCSTSVVLG